MATDAPPPLPPPGLTFGAPRDFSNYVTAAKVLAKVIAIVVPAIVGAIIAVKTALLDATAKTQVAKDKSEAGYQATRHAIETLEQHQAELEKKLEALGKAPVVPPRKAGARPAPRHPMPAPVPSMSPKAPLAKALPADLDKALGQIQRPREVEPAAVRAPEAPPAAVPAAATPPPR